MSGRIHAERLNSLWELGEEGEQALLQIARSGSAAKACAIMFLCELESPAVMPVVQEVLSKGVDKREIAREWEAQYEALRCLRRFPFAGLVDEVVVFTQSDNLNAALAIEVLGGVDSCNARQRLRELLIAPIVEGWAYSVVGAVAAQRDRLAIPLLLKLSERSDFNDAKGSELIEAMAKIDVIGAAESALAVARRMRKPDIQRESMTRYLEELRKESTTSLGERAAQAQEAIEQVQSFVEQEIP